MEVLFEIFGELIFQVVFSLLGELFSGVFGAGFKAASKWSPPPALKALLYLAAGCGLCWLSLQMFPNGMARRPEARMIVLIGTPLACGLTMGLIKGLMRKQRMGRDDFFSLYGFAYGVLFALPISLGRFLFAH
ncbi:MAG TPA: hypothetical protein VGN52_23225 [Burkholderiales bacterium]